MRIAVLGLGRMGQALAGRLLGAGHQVTVWNRTAGRADDLVADGATEAASVSDAVTGANAVLVAFSGDQAVRQVLLPNDQPIAELAGVVIDCSTVAPKTSRLEAESYPDRFVACPIAGAPQAVQSGAGRLIVAGSAPAIERAKPVLDALSDSRQNAGEDAGAAAIIKLLNNYLLLCGLVVLADVVAVGQANGFDDDELAALLKELPVIAPGLENRIDGLLDDRHEPWFSVELGSKDLRLFTELADQAGLRLGVLEAARTRYRETAELGLDQRDLTAVIEPLRRNPVQRTD
jgi:3-hydroxyisobutyrate dehydrogenase-like beta-hydroxyacid dehydrogenase